MKNRLRYLKDGRVEHHCEMCGRKVYEVSVEEYVPGTTLAATFHKETFLPHTVICRETPTKENCNVGNVMIDNPKPGSVLQDILFCNECFAAHKVIGKETVYE